MAHPEHLIDGTLIDDPPMPVHDRKAIRIMDVAEARQVWNTYVHQRYSHLMRLPDDSWPARLIALHAVRHGWHEDWNHHAIEPLRSIIHAIRAAQTPIYFLWGGSTGVATTNGVLADNWLNFLYEDEGCLVISPLDRMACVFSNGRLWIGERT